MIWDAIALIWRHCNDLELTGQQLKIQQVDEL